MINLSKVTDSTLSFFKSQTENLDPVIYKPLMASSWSRDIDLRPNVTDQSDRTSFRVMMPSLVSSDSAAKSTSASGANMNAIPTIAIDFQKTSVALTEELIKVSFTNTELNRAMGMGVPLDTTMLEAEIQLFDWKINQMVYLGNDDPGLLNNPKIKKTTPKTGNWSNATADQIQDDFLKILAEYTSETVTAVQPNRCLLPVDIFYLLKRKNSSAGVMSIMNYLQNVQASSGAPIEFAMNRWLDYGKSDPNINNKNRMVLYNKDVKLVRYPLVLPKLSQRYPIDDSQVAVFKAFLGRVEFIQPETVRYMDGL